MAVAISVWLSWACLGVGAHLAQRDETCAHQQSVSPLHPMHSVQYSIADVAAHTQGSMYAS